MNDKKEYTCPMHQQIRKTEPGSCPICGMTLKLKATSSDKKDENSDKR